MQIAMLVNVAQTANVHKGLAIKHALFPIVLAMVIIAVIIIIIAYFVSHNIAPGQNQINQIIGKLLNS